MRTPVFNVTIARNVQTISPRNDEIFAIRLEPALQAATHYLRDLPHGTFQSIRSVLQKRASQFAGEVTLRSLKQKFVAQLDLHREIHDERHRNSLAQLRTAFQTMALNALSDEERVSIWDNLVHFLWITPNEDIIEAIRAVLVADHFRRVAGPALLSSDIEDPDVIITVRRAMRARVVIPVSAKNRIAEEVPDPLSAVQVRLLRAVHREIIARRQAQLLKSIRDDLRDSLEVIRFAGHAATSPLTPSTPRPETPNGFILNAPTESTFETPRVRIAVRALNVTPRSNLPSRVASITAPDADADEALEQLTDQLDDLESDIEDRNDSSAEDEQVFFVNGAEIAVTERIPPGAFIVTAEPVENGVQLVMTYFHDDGAAPEISDIKGRITGASGSTTIVTEINATEVASGKSAYQHIQLTSEPLLGMRFELSFEFASISRDEGAVEDSKTLHHAGIVASIVPWSVANDPVADATPLFGVNKIGVLDFHRVEEELYCFEASEPSHIENLLAGQHKERMTRRFTSSEVESERTSESGFEREDDSTTTDRFEQQSTIESVLSEEESRNINVNAGVSGGFGEVKMYANTAVTFANSTSREESRADALTFARDITNRVAQKVTSKTTERRRALVRHEFEDVSRHGFDNRGNERHVVGIYRFLDKVYRNRLVNYGRRCVVEWMIPEPAKNFVRAQELAVPRDDFAHRPPTHPEALGLSEPSVISPYNYRKFGKAYGIDDLAPPPSFTKYISRTFAENRAPGSASKEEGKPAPDSETSGAIPQVVATERAVAYEIEIPDDYVATHYEVSTNKSWHIPGVFHGKSVNGGGGEFFGLSPFKLSQSHSVSFQHIEKFPFTVGITLKLKIRESVKRDWQYKTYSRVMEGYRERMAEFDAAKSAYDDELRHADLNPRFKKDIIQRELRRVALYMIQKPHGVDVTHDHYKPASQGKLHTLKLAKKLDRHAAMVRFFEQCFEWDLMAYLLYPYFYSAEKSWSVKLAMEETRNRDFAAFLTSGMARLVVPIRPGFEDAVTHYLQTGEIWFGRGLVLDVENDLYLSIAEEMASGNEETEILDTWFTKIPTNLNILQEDAAAIVGDGLPCLDEEKEPIATGTSVLPPLVTPPVSDE